MGEAEASEDRIIVVDGSGRQLSLTPELLERVRELGRVIARTEPDLPPPLPHLSSVLEFFRPPPPTGRPVPASVRRLLNRAKGRRP